MITSVTTPSVPGSRGSRITDYEPHGLRFIPVSGRQARTTDHTVHGSRITVHTGVRPTSTDQGSDGSRIADHGSYRCQADKHGSRITDYGSRITVHTGVRPTSTDHGSRIVVRPTSTDHGLCGSYTFAITEFKAFRGYFGEEFKVILAIKNTKATASRRLPLVDS